jgi:hypothetical protein
MTLPADQSPPADVCLLLRAHAEARWLSRERVPLVRELEHGRAREPEEDLASAAAVAYLEVLAIEARHHAAETDAARTELDALAPNADHALHGNARRYHAAVWRLRATIDRRVQRLLSDAGDATLDREHPLDAVADAPALDGLRPEHETAQERVSDGGRAETGRGREAGRTHGLPLRRRAERRV